jgi:hypothetical protein
MPRSRRPATFATAEPTMRFLRSTAVAAALLAASACTDAPSGPSPAVPRRPNLELVDPAVTAVGLTRDVALGSNVTVSFVVPKSGGSYHVPGTGLRVTVPANAFRGKELKITVTALAGSMVAYNFEPHGTVFNNALLLTQDMRGTNYWHLDNPGTVEAGYFADPSQIVESQNLARINEFLPVTKDVVGNKLAFSVKHFSGYMVSSGRR